MSPSANSAASPPLATSTIDFDDNASLKSVSPTGTTASSGIKRKRGLEPKFYSVRVGHRPGIYHSWNECLDQVRGFKNATFKSFPRLTDAERFLAGEDPGVGGNGSSSGGKFYAVRNGRVPGIYTDWPSAQKQITGWTKPKHKCFQTRAEAQRFLGEGDRRLSAEDSEHRDIERTKRSATSVIGINKAMRPVEEPADIFEPGIGPLPHGSQDGFDPDILLDPETGNLVYKTIAQRDATKLQAIGPTSDSMLRVFTDGSSLKNGQDGAFAGVGVYFGPADNRNLSETLPGPRQTNQRAELTAVLRALETIPKDRDVTIVTDSRYAIDCVTSWYVNWRKNGWKTAAGKTVENRDLVETILGRIEERGTLQTQTIFEWIKGHANHPGNVEADRLAVNGARKHLE